jgi:hypothetical protein
VLTMAPTDQGKIVPPAGDPEEHPPLSDPKSIFLGGLFVLALLATAFVAREIVLPLVFAIVLKLLLQPAFRVLERLHIPRLLAALLLILGLFGTVAGLGTAISGPARTWAAKLPESVPGSRSDRVSCGSPSMHCKCSCSRWKILVERNLHHMVPSRSGVRRF